MSKKQIGKLKLKILPKKATPAPPIGPALGQKGLNIAEFCKKFNDQTKDKDPSMPVVAEITAFSDRSFTFVVKEPPTSALIKKALKISKASQTPGRETIASLKKEDAKRIAEIKKVEMGDIDLEAAEKQVIGTAKSMGINIIE